jgi:hypothetical protein
MAMQFIPNSPRPPRGMIWSFLSDMLEVQGYQATGTVGTRA